jgi:hypothetical protein
VARKYTDGGERPWPTTPKNLAVYIPEQWNHGRQQWHAARADVARSLGRRALPEIAAMTANVHPLGVGDA